MTKRKKKVEQIIHVDENGMRHSMWSPSSGKRWINCPASVLEAQNITKKRKPSKAAQDGSTAHKHGELILLGEEEYDAIEDPEMREGVQCYVDAVEKIYNEYNNPEFEVESELDLSHILPSSAPKEWTCFGNSDCVIWDEDNKEPPTIIDFKYGRKLVEACSNDQLMLYAHSVVTELGYDGPHVRVVIIQPRASHKDGPVRECVVSLKQLEARAKDAMKAIHNAATEDPPRKASGDWCDFCPVASKCDVAKQMVQNVAMVEFDDMDKGFEPIAFDQMTDYQIMQVLKYRKTIENWMDEVASEATQRALGGDVPHGTKLVRNSGRSAWESDEVYDQMIEDLDLSEIEEGVYNEKPKSISDIKKILALYYDESPEELLADYIHKSKGTIVLVPESDGRIEYNPAATEFSEE